MYCYSSSIGDVPDGVDGRALKPSALFIGGTERTARVLHLAVVFDDLASVARTNCARVLILKMHHAKSTGKGFSQ